jgi:hypothetical protein
VSRGGARVTPNYSTEENVVFRRYVEALRHGKYDTAYEATCDCYRELEHLWRAHPNEKWAAGRTFKAVMHQLHIRAQATGRRAFGAAWSAEESDLLDRYARALAQNRFRLARQAASAYLEEMNQRRLEHPEVYAPRLPGRVSHVLAVRARELGWAPKETRLAPEENRVLDRYTRRFLAGEFPTLQATAEKCMRELAVVYRNHPTLRAKSLSTVWSYLTRRVHGRGVGNLQRRWSSQEMAVVRRYADGLMRNRYAKVTAAATDCFRELERLRRSVTGRAQRQVRRTRVMTMTLLGKLTREAGRVACQNQWTRHEMRVLTEHAQALVGGVYCDSEQACIGCARELARLHLERPQAYGPRGAGAVAKFLPPLAHKLGWSGAHSQLHPVEERMLDRYKRDFIKGEFPSAEVAARACQTELARLRSSIPTLRPKTLSTLRTYINRRSRWLGVRSPAPKWTPQEEERAAKYARALVEGRYRTATAAAGDCLKELAQFRGNATRGRVKTKSAENVAHRVRVLADRLPVPRPNGRWAGWETRIIRRFAQAVATGSYAGPTPAFEPCFSALNRRYARLRAVAPIPLRSVGGRTRAAVYRRLDMAARRLGWHGHPAPRWTSEENRISRRWVRWYGNHRRGRRGPITPAAEGLQEELDQIGARRSVPACKHHVRQQYLRQHGLA